LSINQSQAGDSANGLGRLALHAIRALGSDANKDFIVCQLSRALSARDRAQLAKLIKHAPAWSHEIIRRLMTLMSSVP
jgi:hypothetical protein